jgi:hypothetical protein
VEKEASHFSPKAFVNQNDNLYLADSRSDAKRNPAFKRGRRIGSVKDGTVKAIIPGLGADPESHSVGEGVAADAKRACNDRRSRMEDR